MLQVPEVVRQKALAVGAGVWLEDLPLLVASLATVAIGALLPISPLAQLLGFGHLSPLFYLALLATAMRASGG